ncbi:MAG: hypothetical protein RIS52_1728, partial [Pseudomonadota bacterium]
HGVAVTLIDVKPAQIEVSGTFGAKVYYGDGRRIDILRKAGASAAQLILFCGDDKRLSMIELETIKASFPEAALFVRAYDRRQVLEISDERISVIRELFESAITMGGQALASIGATPDDIEAIEADYRDRDHRRMAAQRDTGDLHALKEIFYRPR